MNHDVIVPPSPPRASTVGAGTGVQPRAHRPARAPPARVSRRVPRGAQPAPGRRRAEAAGYGGTMSEEKTEAMQAVVDRVTSLQDGATESTVEAELRDGFTQAGVDVADADIRKLADAIESRHASVQVQDVLS